MVRINIKLEKRYKRSDGRSKLRVAIHHNGKTLYAGIDFFVFDSDWDESNQRILGVQNRSINTLLQKKKADMDMRLLALQDRGVLRTYTDKQLVNYILGIASDERPHYFYEVMEKYVGSKTNSRTMELYEATIKKLQAFCDYDHITFEEMNVSWLRSFDAWLSEKSPSANARSIHLRNIRTIFNAALDDDLIAVYPFRRFQIPSRETEKRSISVEDMRKLQHLELPKYQEKYRDCFFLVFYLIGINMVDLSRLTTVQQGRISYERAKTHKLYNIKVEPEADAILAKYKGKEHLLSWFDRVKDYRIFAERANKNLQEIAKKNGLPPLTTYVARHSWASYASELDIPKDVISHALGHHVSVTDTYIRFNRDKIDAANRKVIDYLLNKN